jgi:co-chaperonin GroES (HSP10)
MKMIGSKVLVRMKPRATVSEGGIHIPAVSQTTELWGTVQCVGEGAKDLVIGDEVLIEAHLGTHFIMRGEDHIIIEAEKIKAKRELLAA